jgi:MFS family permease
MSVTPPAPPTRNENVLIFGMAISQVIAIGCLFHSFTLFLAPLQKEFGWTATQMTGAFTLGLITADIIAIPLGQWVDRHGGHLIMSLGAAAAAVCLAAWTLVDSIIGFYVMWLCMGLCMGSTLGNTSAAIIAANVKDYRRGLTYLSIIAGFSSTIVVPVVSYLVAYYGWRAGVMGLAFMQFFGPACINAFLLRGTVGSRTAEYKRKQESLAAGRPSGLASGNISPLRTALRKPAFWLLAIAASVHWYAITAVNVHIMPLLQGWGVSLELAVLIFSLNGPSAVIGRLLLHIFDRGGSARRQGRLTFPVFAFGMLLLIFAAPTGTLGLFSFAIVFGMAAGVLMIVRQTAIAEIFGLRGYGAVSGALTTVSIIPRTCAPVTIAMMADSFGSYQPVLWFLFVLIVIGTIAFYIASSERARD